MIFQRADVDLVMDRLYGACVARFTFGLVVVSAPASTDAHSDWDPSVQPLHAGPDSLYVSIRPAAGGLVSIACVEGPYAPEGVGRMYTGDLVLPGASLAIYDPDGAVDLRLPVARERNTVDVYGDDPEESSKLWIVLTEMH